MRDKLVLYTNPGYPLLKEIKQYYPGVRDTDTSLIIHFLNNKIFEIESTNNFLDNFKLDLNLINSLEIKAIEQKFKGRFYEDYSRDIIKYLYQTNRLNNNDYQFFIDKLNWTLEVNVKEDTYGYFNFTKVPLKWGAEKNHDSLLFVIKQNKIIDIYSGKNSEDEYLFETIRDRKKLNLNSIEDKYLTEFYKFAFFPNYQGMK